jgi:protein-histidine pros-kinase
MKLLMKFNLVVLLIMILGLLIVSRIARSFLMDNARAQVVRQAELMMESAKATRDYTSEELKPLLAGNPLHRHKFLPQTVPAYGAMTTFDRLRKKFPDYTYKEASLNPSNPQHRAVDWEADIIENFRNHPDNLQVVGERSTPTGDSLYLAHPIAAKPVCLECHNVPSQAPKAMLAKYGTTNGFGWKPNEIIAAQIVSVPMSVPVGIANDAFRKLMLYLTLTFAAVMIAVDVVLYFLIVVPVRKLSQVADQVSMGEIDAPELPVHGKDEISDLTASFNRMYVSVAKALKLLND